MIDLQSISFGYPGREPIFKNLSTKLVPGSIYGLLGSNGAGKSSFLKLLSGLVFPQMGTLTINDATPAKREPAFLQTIFFVPEEIDTPGAHVLGFAKDLSAFYPNFNLDLFGSLLEEFQVPALRFREMSFGQKKKAWIALGIAARTKVLILDEPTNGLDIPSKKQFRKLLAGTICEDTCVIISTHQVKDLENLIDHIVIIDNGDLLLHASTSEITGKLHFKRYNNKADIPPHIYAESSLLGTVAVSLNTGIDSEDQLDIELLYNTCLANRPLMKELFTPIKTTA